MISAEVAVRGCLAGLALLSVNCKPEAKQRPASPTNVTVKGECDEVDDTRLEAVVECVYSARRAISLWRFFSSAAQGETTAADLAKDDRSQFEFSDVRIAKQDSIGGSVFAAVSRTRRLKQADGGLSCSDTKTISWIKEGTAWRMLGGYDKVSELTEKKFDAGDYSGAAASAEDWLKIDPLSIEAYQKLGFAVARGARGKSKDDVVRAVLGIDAKNSTALFLAVSLAEDPDVAENYLRQFKADDCGLETAIGNVATGLLSAERPGDALVLLNKWSSIGPFTLQRIEALSEMHRSKEVAALLTPPICEGIRRELEGQDASYAAFWSSVVAGALIEAGENDRSREWIDFGLNKDPSNAGLAKLLRTLKRRNPESP